MRYYTGIRKASSHDDYELANGILHSGVPSARAKDIYKDRMDYHEFNYGMEDTRELDDPCLDIIDPKLNQLVKEVKTPQDFLDPLHMTLMKGK